jgi:hypothetical protein
MLGREVQFIGLGIEFSREPTKFFLGEEIEAVPARLPTSGCEVTEVIGGHEPVSQGLPATLPYVI